MNFFQQLREELFPIPEITVTEGKDLSTWAEVIHPDGSRSIYRGLLSVKFTKETGALRLRWPKGTMRNRVIRPESGSIIHIHRED